MNTYLTQFKDWFRGLAPRERLLVSVCAAVLGVTFVFLGVWEPLNAGLAKRQVDLTAAQALAQRLEVIAAELQKNRAAGGGQAINTEGSLLTIVDQASKTGTLGMPLTRIQPEGDSEVKVWVDGVSFNALVQWISELEKRYGITTQTADIEKGAGPGQVNARLSLVRQ